jgi:glycerophosphoryl diester phosphodiesterase
VAGRRAQLDAMAGRSEDGAPAWDVVIVAHRGQVAGYPENTLAAYRESVTRGFPAIEVDLRATADGQIVIMHDETVDRTTSGSGKVESMTFAEIRSLDAGSHAHPRFADQRVPTYQEVLDVIRGTGTKLVIDIKPGPALDHERVVRLTEQHGAVLDVLVGPRNVDDLRDFKRLNPNLRTLGLVPGPEFEPPDRVGIEQFARAGADMIRLWPPWIFADRGPDSEPGPSRRSSSGSTISASRYGPPRTRSTRTSTRIIRARTCASSSAWASTASSPTCPSCAARSCPRRPSVPGAVRRGPWPARPEHSARCRSATESPRS